MIKLSARRAKSLMLNILFVRHVGPKRVWKRRDLRGIWVKMSLLWGI